MKIPALRIGVKNNFGMDKGDIAKGNYGQVYTGVFKKKQIAIKFIPFSDKEDNQY